LSFRNFPLASPPPLPTPPSPVPSCLPLPDEGCGEHSTKRRSLSDAREGVRISSPPSHVPYGTEYFSRRVYSTNGPQSKSSFFNRNAAKSRSQADTDYKDCERKCTQCYSRRQYFTDGPQSRSSFFNRNAATSQRQKDTDHKVREHKCTQCLRLFPRRCDLTYVLLLLGCDNLLIVYSANMKRLMIVSSNASMHLAKVVEALQLQRISDAISRPSTTKRRLSVLTAQKSSLERTIVRGTAKKSILVFC